MVDLEGQTKRIRPEIDAAIARVLDSSRFMGGDGGFSAMSLGHVGRGICYSMC